MMLKCVISQVSKAYPKRHQNTPIRITSRVDKGPSEKVSCADKLLIKARYSTSLQLYTNISGHLPLAK